MNLHKITLVCIDCKDINRVITAVNMSCRYFNFGEIKIFTSIPYTHPNIIKIDPILSGEEYSHFCLFKLHEFINTQHCLIIQHDGFVIGNESSWNNDFLNYDYIGAVWPWEPDESCVGNGGFSLRSKKLLKLTSEFNFNIKSSFNSEIHPEDEQICRTFRKDFEKMGIKYAPKDLAMKFSIESHGKYTYSGQFGFHGTDLLKQFIR